MNPTEKLVREIHPEWSEEMVRLYTPPIVQDEKPAFVHPFGTIWIRGLTADNKICWV